MGATFACASMTPASRLDFALRLKYGLQKQLRGADFPMASIDNGSDLGIEASLFKTADKLRGNMEPSDYKHVALGLIFLKHISDGFEAKRAELLAEYPAGAEDPDEYLADNIFWVPAEARWSHLQASARQPTIGRLMDEAMIAIEKVNPVSTHVWMPM